MLMNIRKSESDLDYFITLDKPLCSEPFFAMLSGDNYSKKKVLENFA